MRAFAIYILMQLQLGHALSQVNVKHLETKKELGYDYSRERPIWGTEYRFPLHLHSAEFDSTNNYVLIEIGKKTLNGRTKAQYYFNFDLIKEEVLWAKKNTSTYSRIYSIDGNIFWFNEGYFRSLVPETGEEKWKTKYFIYSIDPHTQLGFGLLLYDALNNKMIIGIDTKTGTEVWERYLPQIPIMKGPKKGFGEDMIFNMNNGLYSLNIHTGKGWNYTRGVNTTSEPRTLSKQEILVSGISSSPVVDENGTIYYATRDYIIALDHTGKELWKNELHKDYTSKSRLFIEDNTIFFINLGYANKLDKKIRYGLPFLASYNRFSGERNFSFTLLRKRQAMNHIYRNSDTLWAIYDKGIQKIELDSGSILLSKQYSLDKDEELLFEVNDKVYQEKDSVNFRTLRELSPGRKFVLNSKNEIIQINRYLEIEKKIKTEAVSYRIAKIGSFSILKGHKHIMVIDNEGHLISRIEFETTPMLTKESIIETLDQSLISVKYSDMLPTNPGLLEPEPIFMGKPIWNWFQDQEFDQ